MQSELTAMIREMMLAAPSAVASVAYAGKTAQGLRATPLTAASSVDGRGTEAGETTAQITVIVGDLDQPKRGDVITVDGKEMITADIVTDRLGVRMTIGYTESRPNDAIEAGDPGAANNGVFNW